MAFDDLTAEGFQSSEFEWLDAPSIARADTIVSKIRHKESDYYFLFDHGPDSPYGSHYYERSPGETVSTDRGYPGGWDLMRNAFVEWTRYLKREIESPDYWTDIAGQSEIGKLFSDMPNNDPISDEDQLRITEAVEQIRNYLKEKEEFEADYWKSIDEKLDLIIDSSKTNGRKAWVMLAIGGLISIFSSGIFAPEQASTYFHYAIGIIKTALTQIRSLGTNR